MNARRFNNNSHLSLSFCFCGHFRSMLELTYLLPRFTSLFPHLGLDVAMTRFHTARSNAVSSSMRRNCISSLMVSRQVFFGLPGGRRPGTGMATTSPIMSACALMTCPNHRSLLCRRRASKPGSRHLLSTSSLEILSFSLTFDIYVYTQRQ